jgi:hypothetical protein
VDVVKDVSQTEMNTAEPLVSKPCSEVGIVTDNWKNCKSPDADETSWLLVRKQTIPTERPSRVAEVSANFCGQRVSRVVSATDPHGR